MLFAARIGITVLTYAGMFIIARYALTKAHFPPTE